MLYYFVLRANITNFAAKNEKKKHGNEKTHSLLGAVGSVSADAALVVAPCSRDADGHSEQLRSLRQSPLRRPFRPADAIDASVSALRISFAADVVGRSRGHRAIFSRSFPAFQPPNQSSNPSHLRHSRAESSSSHLKKHFPPLFLFFQIDIQHDQYDFDCHDNGSESV